MTMSRSDLEKGFLALWRMMAVDRTNGMVYPDPVEQFQFYEHRRWRFDFCWPDALVAVEIEGAVFAGGRHARGAGIAGDAEKYNTATFLGWAIVRMTDRELRSNPVDTCTEIARLIRRRMLDGVTRHDVDSYALKVGRKAKRVGARRPEKPNTLRPPFSIPIP